MGPKVSVIMAVLNGERFISEAIQSIADQTYANRELVVVDDGSSDGTRACIDAFRSKLETRYVRHDKNQGIARSINDGLRHATGDLIAMLDHDDAWFPEFLETQVNYLREHPDVAMVHSDFQTIDVNGKVIEESVAALRGYRRPSGYVFPQLFMDSFIVGNSVLIRRECIERFGGFNESLRFGDYHLWLQIALHNKVDYVNKVLTKYRQHPTQTMRSADPSNRPLDETPVGLQALEKVLEDFPEARAQLDERAIRRRRASFHFNTAYAQLNRGDLDNARGSLRVALRLWPTNRSYLKLYALTLLGASRATALRSAWNRLRGREAGIGVRGITR